MSKVIITATIASILLIAGCENNNESPANQANSNLVGEWLTDACNQQTNPSGDVIDEWWKGIYVFSSEGTIVSKHRRYLDSTCNGSYLLLFAPNFEPVIEYRDLGEETLQEGMQGNRIRVNFTFENQTGAIEGFYFMSNDSLCFSSNINLNADSIALSGVENTTIDYEKCLTRIVQP